MLALDVRGGDITVIVVAFESGDSGGNFTAGRWEVPDREVKTCVRDHLAHGNLAADSDIRRRSGRRSGVEQAGERRLHRPRDGRSILDHGRGNSGRSLR